MMLKIRNYYITVILNVLHIWLNLKQKLLSPFYRGKKTEEGYVLIEVHKVSKWWN